MTHIFGERPPALLLSVLILFMCLTSCQTGKKGENASVDDQALLDKFFKKFADQELLEMTFQAACENKSTFPSYVVIEVENLITRQIKEICCETSRLREAMHIDHQLGYSEEEIITADCMILDTYPQAFGFRHEDALDALRFFTYPCAHEILNKVETMNLETYYQKYRNNDQPDSFHFGPRQQNEQLMFAHILFQMGIMTKQGGERGNAVYLGKPDRKENIYEEDKRYKKWRAEQIGCSKLPLPQPN